MVLFVSFIRNRHSNNDTDEDSCEIDPYESFNSNSDIYT
jgi:hypothetical protein